MNITETELQGCYLIAPRVFEDERGEFYESYNQRELENQIGQSIIFVQDNLSVSRKGALRGLHYQKGDYAQAKLVRVFAGEVLDVVVDIRKGSPTYGQYYKSRLSAENHRCLFIPKGMAHGFLSLADDTVFAYKCDNYYCPESEGGIIYNDPDLAIDWEYPVQELLLSAKDLKLPAFKNLQL